MKNNHIDAMLWLTQTLHGRQYSVDADMGIQGIHLKSITEYTPLEYYWVYTSKVLLSLHL